MSKLVDEIREKLEDYDDINDGRVMFAYRPDHIIGAYRDGRSSRTEMILKLVKAIQTAAEAAGKDWLEEQLKLCDALADLKSELKIE